jgi:hypothetical protein
MLAISQPYLPVLEENNEWSVAYWDFFAGGYVNVNNYNFIGEELINGKLYKIMYSDGVITTCRMREENGVIYSLDTSIGTESAMIDFNVQIGDVLTEGFYCPNSFGGTIATFEVINITSEFIAGETRKVIELEGFDDLGDPFGYLEYWVEGIGSLNGLAPFSYNWDFFNLLTCFKRDGTTYLFNDFNSCAPPLSIDDQVLGKIIIAPNPVMDISILKLPSELEIDQLRIYDITGRLISEENITKNYSTIKAMDYAAGLYFYQAISKNKVIKTNRFIVK